MRAFPVSLPSGQRYWTVLDEDLQVVGGADEFPAPFAVRPRRRGVDDEGVCGSIALFLRWCARSGRSWQAGVEQFALFMTWLAHARPVPRSLMPPRRAWSSQVLVRRCDAPSRINGVLTAVRGMVVHAVAAGHGASRGWWRCCMRSPTIGIRRPQAADEDGPDGVVARRTIRVRRPAGMAGRPVRTGWGGPAAGDE